MDEGMTGYASSKVMQQLFPREWRPACRCVPQLRGPGRSDRHGSHEPACGPLLAQLLPGVTAYSKGSSGHQLAR